MKSKFILRISILFVATVIYLLIFLYTNNDKNNRIKTLTNQQIENLKTHYNLTTKYFRITADATVDILNNDKEIIKILTEFPNAADWERIEFRKSLYEKLLSHYNRIQKQGVLQFHFLMPDNVTSLRMHKPTKFDDNLTDFKYSFRYVNETKKPISGLERGRTSPSFRNVTPLFSADAKHIGAVDVAFAPEILQKDLYETSKIYSHFIIKKNIFDGRKWNRNDDKNDYRNSIENDNYYEYSYQDYDKDKQIFLLVKELKKEIEEKMEYEETFSLYTKNRDTYSIIAFLPIKNMENELIAYLVSYTDSKVLKNMFIDFYSVNIIVIISLLIIAFFLSRSIISNRELSNEKKRFFHLSQYDALTELPNRSFFYDRINSSIATALRTDSKFALLFIDLDNFKDINDSYGHNEGDKLLHIAGVKIKHVLREEDTLARLGGDEFVVIVEEINNLQDVSAIANHIIDTLKTPIKIGNNIHYIGASIGISIFPDDSRDSNDLLMHADVAMYSAKENGKNNAEFYSKHMTENVVERVRLENELREAIKKDEFVIFYQPQINGTDDSVVGMEALVRWNHPERGMVSPLEFIPIAEDTGLIIELGQLIFSKAIKQISIWYKKDLNPGVMAINISVKQLQQKDFITFIQKVIDENQCNPEWIELEITESQIMKDTEDTIEKLNNISELGIELAIDDFGTGYSSLSYLKRLPIDKLKIDRSFVEGLPDDEEDVGIAKAVIALSKSLNLKVIAEGVETKEQKDFIVQCGCNHIQGYYYSKPMPADEMESFLLNKI